MRRDFTYIDDIVEGVMRIQDVIPVQEQQTGHLKQARPQQARHLILFIISVMAAR